MKHRITTQSTPQSSKSVRCVVKQNIQTIVIAFLLLVIGCQQVYAETNAIKNVNTSISDTGNLIVDADGDGEDDIVLSSDSTKVIAGNQQVLADNQKTLSNSLSSINSSIGNTQQAGSITTQLNTMNTKLEAISSSLDGNQFDVGDMAVNFTFNAKGNATPADVLEGVTYSAGDGTSEGIINGVGTIPRQTAIDWNPTTSASKTYPAGYYPNSWTVNTQKVYEEGTKEGKKVVNLGRSSTYSVAAYPGYQNFTVANNFLIGSYSASMSNSYQDAHGSGSVSQSISYNSSTGILTVNVNTSYRDSGYFHERLNGSISGNQPNVWLVY